MAYTRAAGVTGAIRRALAGASMAEGIGFCSCRSDDRPRPFETAEANRAAYSELSPLSLNVLLRYIIVCSLSDTCKSVAKAHNITTVQLRSYTPRIDGGCYNFNRTIGTEICMDEPWNKYHAPSSVVGSTSVPCTACQHCSPYADQRRGQQYANLRQVPRDQERRYLRYHRPRVFYQPRGLSHPESRPEYQVCPTVK